MSEWLPPFLLLTTTDQCWPGVLWLQQRGVRVMINKSFIRNYIRVNYTIMPYLGR